MNTRKTPRELARDLSARAAGKYHMASVLSDSHGIFAWGWNYPVRIGEKGIDSVHAEEHAIKRANPRRLPGSILTVYGEKDTGKLLLSRPCKERCEALAKKHGVAKIEYSSPDGWRVEKLAYVEEAR